MRLNVFSSAVMSCARHIATTLPRVIPPRQKRPSDVQTSGSSGVPFTMKKWVLLQVATKPCGSSISASSAPA